MMGCTAVSWIAVKELKLSHCDKVTLLVPVYLEFGNLS